MKLVAYPLAALLAAFGLIFVVSGARGQPYQIAVGMILWVAGGALIWLALATTETVGRPRSCRKSTSPAT